MASQLNLGRIIPAISEQLNRRNVAAPTFGGPGAKFELIRLSSQRLSYALI